MDMLEQVQRRATKMIESWNTSLVEKAERVVVVQPGEKKALGSLDCSLLERDILPRPVVAGQGATVLN